MGRGRRRDPLEAAFYDGIAAIRTSVANGNLSEAGADVLLRHLLAAYTSRRISDLVSATVSPERMAEAMTGSHR